MPAAQPPISLIRYCPYGHQTFRAVCDGRWLHGIEVSTTAHHQWPIITTIQSPGTTPRALQSTTCIRPTTTAIYQSPGTTRRPCSWSHARNRSLMQMVPNLVPQSPGAAPIGLAMDDIHSTNHCCNLPVTWNGPIGLAVGRMYGVNHYWSWCSGPWNGTPNGTRSSPL